VRTRLLGIAGYKNSGKTTLVERLVKELCARGYRVSTVKHAHHGFDVDQEGRDSWRHRQAGAWEVAVGSAKRWALVHELKGEPEPRLQEILAKMAPCDLILTEGSKGEGHAKIEVRDVALRHPELAGHDGSVIAIAASGHVGESPVPVFDRDNIAGLAEFIIERLELPRK
jgi:molybdopterin-guanine dinucleotide biosynthesis adapter protein